MRNIYICLLTILTLIYSCKKSNSSSGVASLNVIQATLDVPSIYVYFTATPSNFYLQQSPIGNFSSGEFGVPSSPNIICITSSVDTTKSLFQGIFNLKTGGVYSLYLAGLSGSYDTLFLQDQIPYYTDSSAGVRFINLSPGSMPMSVNIAGNSESQKEFSNLGYKQISGFNKYSAGSTVGGTYSFEIRNQANDSLLATFTWNFTLQKNNTIVIGGQESTNLTIFQVNNY